MNKAELWEREKELWDVNKSNIWQRDQQTKSVRTNLLCGIGMGVTWNSIFWNFNINRTLVNISPVGE